MEVEAYLNGQDQRYEEPNSAIICRPNSSNVLSAARNN